MLNFVQKMNNFVLPKLSIAQFFLFNFKYYFLINN